MRAAYPKARITLMASPAGAQAAPMLPWIDDVFVWRAIWQEISPKAQFDPYEERDLVEYLRLGNYDAAFIFTSFRQSPYPPAYSAALAGVPIRVGQSKEFGGQVLTHGYQPPDDETHQVDRNMALISSYGIPDQDRTLHLAIEPAAISRVDKLIANHGLDPNGGFICVVPGASCTARRYPTERYSEVVRGLCEAQPLPVLVLGAEKEKARFQALEETVSNLMNAVSLIGETSVMEFAEIIRRASVILANNSSALHIADAFSTPMVILFSGTDTLSQWQPRKSPSKILSREVECSPCYLFDCPYQQQCLDVPADEVIAAVLKLLLPAKPDTGEAVKNLTPHEEILNERTQ
jgi:ADP-heptose:LPS heptosyltransferase